MSKFYEPEVQAVVEHNKNTFDPDSDAVTEALETLRNSDLTTMCSYDAINRGFNSSQVAGRSTRLQWADYPLGVFT